MGFVRFGRVRCAKNEIRFRPSINRVGRVAVRFGRFATNQEFFIVFIYYFRKKEKRKKRDSVKGLRGIEKMKGSKERRTRSLPCFVALDHRNPTPTSCRSTKGEDHQPNSSSPSCRSARRRQHQLDPTLLSCRFVPRRQHEAEEIESSSRRGGRKRKRKSHRRRLNLTKSFSADCNCHWEKEAKEEKEAREVGGARSVVGGARSVASEAAEEDQRRGGRSVSLLALLIVGFGGR